MSAADTADLIAFVRAARGQVTNRMALDLADAIEAAGAQRDRAQRDADAHAERAIQAEAQRDTLAEALRWVASDAGSVDEGVVAVARAALAAVTPPEAET